MLYYRNIRNMLFHFKFLSTLMEFRPNKCYNSPAASLYSMLMSSPYSIRSLISVVVIFTLFVILIAPVLIYPLHRFLRYVATRHLLNNSTITRVVRHCGLLCFECPRNHLLLRWLCHPTCIGCSQM